MLTLYSINLATVYLLICLHYLIILIWHYLIRLIFWYPPLLLSAELIISFHGLILSLLTRGNYFVNYNVNMHPLNLNLILFHLKFAIALQEKTSLPNCHIALICSLVMEYVLSKLINYLSP